MSTWQAATEFFEPWFYGFASHDSISLSRDSIFSSREFHILAMKSHLQAADLFTKSMHILSQIFNFIPKNSQTGKLAFVLT
jgi:hypothetical protein